jgi:hypothetical protein
MIIGKNGVELLLIPKDVIITHMMLLGSIRRAIATDLRYSHTNSGIRKVDNSIVGDYKQLENAIKEYNEVENETQTSEHTINSQPDEIKEPSSGEGSNRPTD